MVKKKKKQTVAEHDKDLAVEIAWYIINDGQLYRQMRRPIALNYARKKVKGQYKHDLALKGIDNLVKVVV